MGSSELIKKNIRAELKEGIFKLWDKECAMLHLNRAHELSSPFVRLHIGSHAALFLYSVAHRKPTAALRELWLAMAAGPVVLRDRLKRIG